jgi:hypothetical protein
MSSLAAAGVQSCSMSAVELVEPITKFFAGLKERHEFLGDRNGRARTGISSLTRRPMFHGKGTKTTKLDTVASGQGIDDFIEDDIHDALDVAMVKMRISRGNLLDQF